MRLAREVKAAVSIASRAELNAGVVWFCVPDAKISEAATELANRDWRGQIALHSSGALSSDLLDALRRKGASVASAHPLMTFVRGSRPSLAGVSFAIEGDAAAQRVARQIVRSLGGAAFGIRKQDKIAYHAFATMICPLLISLLATSERVAAQAGISPNDARRRMMPIIRQTLANYERLGAAGSFSGPIVRGDVETIARHLTVLRKAPETRRVYSALAEAALNYLPNQNRSEISRLLSLEPQTAHRNGQGKGPGRRPQVRQR